MITAAEIQKKSERKYEEVLRDSLNGESCFPLEIRSNKVLSKDFIQMSREIAEVLGGSKDRKGFGYSVVSETIKTRQHGIQDIPKSIVYETLDDYLKFIKKEKEFHVMMENYTFIKSELPQLEPWLKENPKAIINNVNVWAGLVKVCQWFLLNFEPDKYYIRELPIAVHTKFIEENKGVLRVLLDELVPNLVNISENHFERRFCLKYDQPLVRLRSLDKACWIEGGYDDITVPIEQFMLTELKCLRVFIIENKMNFLSFPEVPHSLAIWGKGFAIESLKNIQWLKNKQIFYWSDLDVQGFQMLSQLRSYFPQTKSFLMDIKVLEMYKEFIVSGTVSKGNSLSHLSNEELEVFEHLFNNNFRLEQERIHQSLIIERLSLIFK
ncbi:Wadjet anti-phage system protein JetD domain-containing protein [Flagellimonas halotolerans]|uniref:Wadjet anti-phage system protein JetD domain-containing protein n=1 Tax=Flagellimonas halotolerans TaxID=3112164 RepID=A0ABU6IL59_9FLAO|nr:MULTISPECIES: Wadjet anti-phage system protein JetD domain-containing protein [unclassified Allomuricauda]MEC3963850.1 Wadjet anti-phage system protein JetD domain-containing protein [Muricauda sp. SYSU M86414]MEC4263720.1 Wadjet anti-phage system protein JetD domain-containing protein [Muricauda sp. SYSU M84420]